MYSLTPQHYYALSEVTCHERCFYICFYLLRGLKQHNPHMYDICYNPQMCGNSFEIHSQYQKLSWLVSSNKKMDAVFPVLPTNIR